jgi:hypothetical protein
MTIANAAKSSSEKPDAPETTYEAVCYELRSYGVRALENPNCQRRLGDLSAEQVEKVIAVLIRMRGHSYCPGIDDALLLLLDEGLR